MHAHPNGNSTDSAAVMTVPIDSIILATVRTDAIVTMYQTRAVIVPAKYLYFYKYD
jgi:hypothetical protein